MAKKKRERKDYSVYDRNGVWYVYLIDPKSGERVRYSAETRIKEQALDRAKEDFIARYRTRHLKEAVKWTIRDLLEWAWSNTWSKREHSNRDKFEGLMAKVFLVLGDQVACAIEDQEITDYVDNRLKDVKKSSVNREFAMLRSAFNLAIKKKHLNENPFSLIPIFDEKANQRTRNANPVERRMLIENSAGLLQDIIEFDFDSGLRKGEIEKLQWPDVDFDLRRMKVMSKKGSKQRVVVRYVPIFDRALEVLKRRPHIGPYVFCNNRGNKIPPDGIIHASYPRLVARLQIHDFTFHDIRHTFATSYYRRTKNLAAISYILGHENIQTTIRYLNLTPEDLMPSAGMDIYQENAVKSLTLDTRENSDSTKTSKTVDNQQRAVSSVG